jgi:hypothetical protein
MLAAIKKAWTFWDLSLNKRNNIPLLQLKGKENKVGRNVWFSPNEH